MKNLFFFFFILIISACNNQTENGLANLRSNYLETLISTEYEQLEERVYASGYTTMGEHFLKHSTELLKRHKEIQDIDDLNQVKKLTVELINFSANTRDSMQLPTDFLTLNLDELSTSTLNDFKINLKLYIAETIRAYHEKYNSYFYMLDFARPVVITNSKTISYGNNFKCEIGLEAALTGIEPEILVSIDDKNEYLPLNISNRKLRGELTILNPTPGTHKLNVKIRYLSNLEERESEIQYTFEVLE